MLAARTLSLFRRQRFNNLSSLFLSLSSQNAILCRDGPSNLSPQDVSRPFAIGANDSCSSLPAFGFSKGWSRPMSTKGRSMRSKVERRMRKESGKTLREIRRAKKLRKKLMTDEERLVYNLKRAKKKAALLLQKLKKYELPELPSPRHDPELLTSEQLQAYKKIGFKNKNYVPVGVRGVFGGVVQNMHLHWKFHETVQVCCDNFPNEKIKEMATMLARLSGGIVINIHNVKTIIMFRGRNYRQPKNLIPINTLTKRKALFKARFEQALESQKLNIKKIEQQLRRMGVNPEDPIAMASIQRVASTFFNAIDTKEGSPYVFHGEQPPLGQSVSDVEQSEPSADSDQEELDRFIAEIEDAADKEWAAEEAAEKEEAGRIRYWNKENFGGRFRRSEMHGSDESDTDVRSARNFKDRHGRMIGSDSDGEDDRLEDDDEWDSDNDEEGTDIETTADTHAGSRYARAERGGQDKMSWPQRKETRDKNARSKFEKGEMCGESDAEDMLSDLENAMWEPDGVEGQDLRESSKPIAHNYRSSSDEEESSHLLIHDNNKMNVQQRDLSDPADDYDESGSSEFSNRSNGNSNARSASRIAKLKKKTPEEHPLCEDSFCDSEATSSEADVAEFPEMGADMYDHWSDKKKEDYFLRTDKLDDGKNKTRKQVDEDWDSD